MSRTDKDRPRWVRSNDPLESRREYHSHRRSWSPASAPSCSDECTIDVPNRPWRERDRKPCGYWLDYRPYSTNVPKWFLDHTWHNPERVRERDKLGEARKLANGGELDDGFDYENYQHRNRGAWYWD